MVAYPLIYGELTSQSYADAAAADPRIDALRAKIRCVEEPQYSIDYHDPAKRSIGNAITITLNDGTVLDEVAIEYPVGHKRRRAEGTPLLMRKFENHIASHFDDAQRQKCVTPFSVYLISAYFYFCRILKSISDVEGFYNLPVDKFTDLFVKA